MNRRMFGKTASMGLLSIAWLGSVFLTGCGLVSDLQAWIPVAVSAITSIVTILGPLVPPGAAAIIVLIKAALADLGATLAEYAADTNPADKASWEAKLSTILTDISTNFQTFLSQLMLGTNPIAVTIIALAQVFLAAVQGFLGQLTSGTTKLGGQMMFVHPSGQAIVVQPKFYTKVSQFKADWNQAAKSTGHPEASI